MSQNQTAIGAEQQLPAEIEQKKAQLLRLLESFGSCVVAFSGGLDSTVVAKAASLALGDRAMAVTGASASIATGELEECRKLARVIGIRHEIVQTDELSNPLYLRNLGDRCYLCKMELFGKIGEWGKRFGMAVVVDGSNRDDQGDYRPGLQAARQRQVRSPLTECDFSKPEIRILAKHWGLPNWDKPASPCLSSRIAYGEEITPERLAMVEKAENFLRENGFHLLRVRYHRGDLARIEVPIEDLPRLIASDMRQRLVETFSAIGFKFISLDLGGFRSGSLNNILPAESLRPMNPR